LAATQRRSAPNDAGAGEIRQLTPLPRSIDTLRSGFAFDLAGVLRDGVASAGFAEGKHGHRAKALGGE
jgi:hypothetical protein